MSYEEVVFEEVAYRGYTIKIIQEGYPESPREDRDGNIGSMVWWHRNYLSPDKDMRDRFEDGLDLLERLSGICQADLEEKYEGGKDYFKIKGRWRDAQDTLSIIRQEAEKKAVILPIYMYEHSGVTISTGSCSCPWDSGQVGYIFATKEKLMAETGHSKDELFSTDTKRRPKKGEHVKLSAETLLTIDRQLVIRQLYAGCDTRTWFVVLGRQNGLLKVAGGYGLQRHTLLVQPESVTEVMSNMAEEILKQEVQTYDDYMNGRVVGYVIEKDAATVDISDESCWGFYPERDNKDGEYAYPISQAKEAIDAELYQHEQRRIEKAKQLIKSRAPLGARQKILVEVT